MKFKLSNITVFWALFIIVSASFLKQVLNFLLSLTGGSGVEMLLWAVFLAVAVFILTILFRDGVPYWRMFIAVLILAYTFHYAWRMKIPEERIHIIKYGLLGWLASRDTMKLDNVFLKVLSALLLCVAVASVDELFQRWLPYRVGDIRDVGFAAVGACIGIGLFWDLKAGGERY